MYPAETHGGVLSDEVPLVSCSICSALFDPATLPSHVYDPYRTFFSFSDHATLCPSCFAEELARRTRPPSSNPSPMPPVQPGDERRVGIGISTDDGRSIRDPTPDFHRPLLSGSKSLDLVRPGTSAGELSFTKPSFTPPMPEHQERSDSAFARSSSLSRPSSSRSGYRQRGHRKASSVTTISRNPSVSIHGSGSDAATIAVGSRSVSGSTFASTKSQSHHKKSGSGGDFPSLERARGFKSQEALRSSKTGHSTGNELKRAASTGSRRGRDRMPSDTHAFALPVPRTSESSHKRMSSSDASTAAFSVATAARQSSDTGTSVRRNVSFRQGAPSAKLFNPQSPPRREIGGAASPLVEGSESGSGSAGNGSALNIPGLVNLSSASAGANSGPRGTGTGGDFENNSPVDIVEVPEEETEPQAQRGLWSRWREKRRQERNQREARRQVRQDRQLQRREREDAEKGIGLELFCSHCRVVVRTVPRWREGSCCFLSAGCLLLCTGPLSLCLLSPCAAHQVMDVDGQCPNCDSVLSHWNRRKNFLTVHTWVGVAGDTAPPLTEETLGTPIIISGGGNGLTGSSTGIGIPLVPLAAIQGQLASSPLATSRSNSLVGPSSRPRTGGRPSSSSALRQPLPGSSGGGVLGGVLVLAQDITTSTPRSPSAGSGHRYPFDPPPLPSLPAGMRPGAVAPTRHLRTPSNTSASASMTYIGGNTTASGSEPATSTPSTGRSNLQHHRRQPSLTYSASVSGNAASSSSGSHGHHPSSSSHSGPGSVAGTNSVFATPRSVATGRTGISSVRAGPSGVGHGHGRNVSMSTTYTGRGVARNSGEGSNSGASASARESTGSNAGNSARDRDSGGSGSLAPVGEGEAAEGVEHGRASSNADDHRVEGGQGEQGAVGEEDGGGRGASRGGMI